MKKFFQRARRPHHIIFVFFLLLWVREVSAELYHQVEIRISGPAAIQKLAQTGIALEEGVEPVSGGIRLILSDSELRNVRSAGFDSRILHRDMETFYRNRLARKPRIEYTALGKGSMGGFYTHDEAIAKLQNLRTKYKKIFSAFQTIGHSVEGRPIFAFKISDNPDQDETEEPEVLYTALHHAREPQTLMCLIYFVEQLLKKYNRNDEITYLVNNRQLWFIPIVNPDGYLFNQQLSPNGGGLWRKNRRQTGTLQYGVDLNRNYGFMWALDNEGSSPNPGDETYRGAAAFSEPETQAIRDFVSSRRFSVALNYHSWGNYFIYPWGFDGTRTPDHKLYKSVGSLLARLAAPFRSGSALETVGYPVNGDSDDWFYGDLSKHQTLALTPEVGDFGDGFWPERDRILPLAKVTYESNLALAWIPGACVYIKNSSLTELQGNGDRVPAVGEKLLLTLKLSNLGLSEDVGNVSVKIKDLPNATMEEVQSSFGTLKQLQSKKQKAFHIVFHQVDGFSPVPIPISIYSGDRFLRNHTIFEFVDP